MSRLKRLGIMLLMVMMIMPLAACSSGGAAEEETTFEGASEGKNGTIKVAVTIEQNEITQIDVVENNESDFTADCFTEMLMKIKEANSTNVDVVSGATITSEAILAAVSEAVEKSGAQLVAKVVEKAAAVDMTAGTYEGEDKGFEGPIKVSVNLSENKIESIEVLSHNESEGHGDVAMETVIASIIDNQRLDVDVVTGASNSSNGVIAAVTKALQSADVDVEAIGGTYIEEVIVLPACQRLTDITPEDAEEGITMYHFDTDGSTCSTGFEITLDGSKVMEVIFEGDPCIGNSEGIKILVYEMEMEEVIANFEGIMCPGAGDISSCPDQLAKGLKQILKIQKGIQCEHQSGSASEEGVTECSGDCSTCPLAAIEGK
jgi:uncharacterized protein (TIGR03905 family)